MNISKDMYMYGLAGVLVVAVLIIIVLMIFFPVPVNQIDTIKAVLVMLAGAVLGIYTYYFGSSKSSADKTELLAKQNESPKP